MSLDVNYKKIYMDKLKNSIDIMNKSIKYDNIKSKIKRLKNDINESLKETEFEYDFNYSRFINKHTKEEITEEIELDLYTKLKFLEFTKLTFELDTFNWKTKINKSFDIVLVLSEATDIEKEIIRQYGKDKGQDIIISMKRELLDYEKELGISYITKEVERYDILKKKMNDLKILYSQNNIITNGDNVDDEMITLSNINGIEYSFRKTSQISYYDNVYICVERHLEINEYEYYLYRYDNDKFVMENDEKIIDIIYDKEEKLRSRC
jgi:hypothetical protein